MMRRSSATATALRPSPTDLTPEDLTPLERKLGSAEATPAEAEAALEALFRRALASPHGYISVVGVPDEDDDDP